jgi:hypothetical protein
MRASILTAPHQPGAVNEDLASVGADWAIVLDGAARYPGVDIGCSHTVAWVVSHLAGHWTAGLAMRPEDDLAQLLADAIRATAGDHGPGCDVGHPLAIGAAAAAVRLREDRVEWLVLSDVAVVLEYASGRIEATVDDRVDRLPDPPVTNAAIRTYEPEYVARQRNQPGGFWVASTRPDAAREALRGSAPAESVRRALVASDGLTRLVERYGHTWADVMATAGRGDLQALLAAVRAAERDDPDPRRWRGKLHDDATAVLIEF